MVTVNLTGVHTVKAKGHTYYYAWRGGPRLEGEPGSPEFMASYREATESRNAPDSAKFRSIIVLYKASPDYQKLADTTKRNWSRWIDRIADRFGTLSISQFDRPRRSARLSGNGEAPMPARRGMPIMGCRCCRGSFLTALTLSARSLRTLARVSSNYIQTSALLLSGPMRISSKSKPPAQQR